MRYTAVCAFLLLGYGGASAHDIPGATPVMQEWYSSVEITTEARKRLPWTKCCNHAEIVRTQFRVDKTDAGDEWYYLDNGRYKRVPPDIIHWGQHAPDGQATLFIFNKTETCFYPPEEGN